MRIPLLSVLILAVAVPLAPTAAQPAAPVAATQAEADAGGRFIMALSKEAFAILRNKQLQRDDARRQFRSMLKENVAVTEIGAKLIRRHLPPKITDDQYRRYQAAFPDFVVGSYADRLYAYADAEFRLLAARPRGTRGDIDVVTRVTNKGAEPFDSVWAVRKGADGQYRITNLTVAGVNLTITQEADFDAYIRRNGFDALVDFMQKSGSRA